MGTAQPETATKPDPVPAGAPENAPRWAVLARILRPQGLRGEVLAEVLTSFPERFAEREQLHLLTNGVDSSASRVVVLESHRFPSGRNSGRIILKFQTLDTIEAVEPLAKLELAVPWAERAQLEDGEYYVPDLIGCLVYAGGRELGTVADVDTGATSIPLLVVRTASGEEHLLPLAKAFLTHVDTGARRIEMTLPEGLLEINHAEVKAEKAAPPTRRVPKWKLRRDAVKAATVAAADTTRRILE